MTTKQQDKDYLNLINLLAIHSEASAQMTELENDMQQAFLDLVDARREDYALLQNTIAKAADAIEAASIMHPEWFAKAKTLKTPYGSVGFRTVSKLEVPNEEVSIVLLEQLGQEGLPFISIRKVLNLEALEKLDDQELERLRIRRVTTESFSVKPARIDMGKAVARAAVVEQKGGSAQ